MQSIRQSRVGVVGPTSGFIGSSTAFSYRISYREDCNGTPSALETLCTLTDERRSLNTLQQAHHSATGVHVTATSEKVYRGTKPEHV